MEEPEDQKNAKVVFAQQGVPSLPPGVQAASRGALLRRSYRPTRHMMDTQDEILVSAEAVWNGAPTDAEVDHSVDLHRSSAATGRGGRKRRREDPPLQLVADDEVTLPQPVEDGDSDAAQGLAAVVGPGGGGEKGVVVRLTTRTRRRRSTSSKASDKADGEAEPAAKPSRQRSPTVDVATEAVVEVEAGELGALCPPRPVSACQHLSSDQPPLPEPPEAVSGSPSFGISWRGSQPEHRLTVRPIGVPVPNMAPGGSAVSVNFRSPERMRITLRVSLALPTLSQPVITTDPACRRHRCSLPTPTVQPWRQPSPDLLSSRPAVARREYD